MRDTLRTHMQTLLTEATVQGKTLTRYIEPFAGGLGSFLSITDILRAHGIREVIIGDVSSGIITLYQHCFHDLAGFQTVYWALEDGFDAVVPSGWKTGDKAAEKKALEKANEYFKARKKEFNTQKAASLFDVKYAALFLFLQKHAFNGVYRENGKGEYNTPFNWSGRAIERKSVNQGLHDWVAVMQSFPSVQFVRASYDTHTYNRETVVYADPPYANEEGTENKYHEDHFDASKQIALINTLSAGSFLYSNHAVPYLETELTNVGASFVYVYRKNIMSGKAETKGATMKELLAKKV